MLCTSLNGSSITKINEPDAFTNRGRLVNKIDGQYEFLIEYKNSNKEQVSQPPLDIMQTGKSLLFSDRLIMLLKKLNIENIQYFIANVIHRPTNALVEYKVANIVSAISGVDMDNSELIMDDDIIIDIDRLVFDENKMRGHNIFRLEESILHVVVHKSVKEAMECANITGVMFLTDDEFEVGMI